MKDGRYKKYVSIAVAMLTVLTVFSVLSVAQGSQAATPENSKNPYLLTQKFSIGINDVKYVQGTTGRYVMIRVFVLWQFQANLLYR